MFITNPAAYLCQVAEQLDSFQDYADNKEDWLYCLFNLQEFLIGKISSEHVQRLPTETLVDIRKRHIESGAELPAIGGLTAPSAIELSYKLLEKVPVLSFCIQAEIRLATQYNHFPEADKIIGEAAAVFPVSDCRKLYAWIERELVFVNVYGLAEDELAVFESCDSRARKADDIAADLKGEVNLRRIKDILPTLEDKGLVHRPHGPRKGYVKKVNE